MAARAGTSSAPKEVSSYSTEGGEVACTVRVTTPRAVSSFRRAESTFAETGGMSMRNSLKRLGPARRCQMTFGAHAPEISARQSVSAQVSGGGGL